MNDSRALKIRVLKYLIPVTIICIVFNITKFFEITLAYIPIPKDSNETSIPSMILAGDSANFTEDTVALSTGDFYEDEDIFPMTNITIPTVQDPDHQEYKIILNITEFRTDPMYSINFNWFRFIAIGVIPFLLLVYFNTQIYLDIRC